METYKNANNILIHRKFNESINIYLAWLKLSHPLNRIIFSIPNKIRQIFFIAFPNIK